MGYAIRAWSREWAVREVADIGYGDGREPAGGSAVGAAGPEPADPDLLEDLGDEIATLAAHLHAAKHRFLTLIARFDRLRGWEPEGHRNCAYWLSWRTGYDLGTAGEYVRVARALESLPLTGAAMAGGTLSFSQVRALSRVAEPETEAELLPLAEGCTVHQLERMVRAWRKARGKSEAEWERERHLSRRLSVFPDEDGMYVVRGRLEPEVGALLMRAVEAASDALVREEWTARAALEGLADGEGLEEVSRDTRREAARRRADALGLLAERALAAGFGEGAAGCGCAGGEGVEGSEAAGAEDLSGGEKEESGCESDCECLASGVPISGTRAERYQVVLHVDRETLAAEGESGVSELEDGTRLSRESARRLACDGSVVEVEHAPDGSILDVGRRTRTIPPALRRALEVRDRGCRFPGCGLRFTDGHHIVHWVDGGETSLRNTVLLCRHHHRLVHEGGWKVEWVGRAWKRGAGWLEFTDPRGVVHASRGWEARPRARRSDRGRYRIRAGGARPDGGDGGERTDRVAALIGANRRRGIDPGPRTAGACWKFERLIPDEVLFRAEEAVL